MDEDVVDELVDSDDAASPWRCDRREASAARMAAVDDVAEFARECDDALE